MPIRKMPRVNAHCLRESREPVRGAGRGTLGIASRLVQFMAWLRNASRTTALRGKSEAPGDRLFHQDGEGIAWKARPWTSEEGVTLGIGDHLPAMHVACFQAVLHVHGPPNDRRKGIRSTASWSTRAISATDCIRKGIRSAAREERDRSIYATTRSFISGSLGAGRSRLKHKTRFLH